MKRKGVRTQTRIIVKAKRSHRGVRTRLPVIRHAVGLQTLLVGNWDVYEDITSRGQVLTLTASRQYFDCLAVAYLTSNLKPEHLNITQDFRNWQLASTGTVIAFQPFNWSIWSWTSIQLGPKCTCQILFSRIWLANKCSIIWFYLLIFCAIHYTECPNSTATPRYIMNKSRYQYHVPTEHIITFFTIFVGNEHFSRH